MSPQNIGSLNLSDGDVVKVAKLLHKYVVLQSSFVIPI